MHNEKTKFKILQNIILVILSIGFIEVAMRFSGSLYNKIQRMHNRTIADGSKVILCLGESTTAWGLENSYPSRLQLKLDQLYGKNAFTVVNEGVPATNTSKILNDLQEKVDKFKPQFVITLMGINDVWAIADETSIFENFKLYKLYKLIKLNLPLMIGSGSASQQVNQTLPAAQNPPPAESTEPQQPAPPHQPPGYVSLVGDANTNYLQKNFEVALKKIKKAEKYKEFQTDPDANYFAGVIHIENGLPDAADKYLTKAFELNRDYSVALGIANQFYRKHGGTDVKTNLLARKFLDFALSMDPNGQDALVLYGMSYFHPPKNEDLALDYFNKAFDLGSRHFDLITSSAHILGRKKLFNAQEKRLLAGLYVENDVIWVWKDLIYFYTTHKKYELAEKYLNEAEKKFPGNATLAEQRAQLAKLQNKIILMPVYSVLNFFEFPPTRVNYKKIMTFLSERKIQPVVMQYPLLPVSPLEDILDDFSNVVFIENKANFEEALKNNFYSDLFVDNFATKFGHFTLKSSDMIADNIIATLQKEKLLPLPPSQGH